MPIYEFECGECGTRFERLSAAGTERTRCSQCGAAGARRRLSSFAYSRQLTAGQRRRLEGRRGVDRGGARERFQSSLDRARRDSGGGREGGP